MLARFSGRSGLGSIFQIFLLTVNQRPGTVTLPPLGLVYLFLCFLCKVSIHHLLRLFYVCLLLKRKDWCLWKISASILLLWRSIVTCNRCKLNIVSSHKCLTYTNQTFCTMSFNRKLIKVFGGIFRNKEAMFVLFLRGRRADFKARAILVLRLHTANLL